MVDGCSSDLRGTQRLCDKHRYTCAEAGCSAPRAGRSSKCKSHKNYSAAPDRENGLRRCRSCHVYKLPSEFNALSRSRGGLQDKCKSCLRDYRAANRDRMQAWRDANREHIRSYNRMYEPRMLELVKSRQATIRSRTVAFTAEQLTSRLSYFGNRCWICGVPNAEHVDHVKPIKAGGWHMLANLRPACGRCNRRKNALWPLTDSDLEMIRR